MLENLLLLVAVVVGGALAGAAWHSMSKRWGG